jgi:trk system potassium uptake protein TrkA
MAGWSGRSFEQKGGDMSIIVIGAGEIGYHVAHRLSLEKKNVTIIDKDIDKVRKIQDSLDVQTVHASGSSLSALNSAGIEHADMVIAVTDSDEVNIVSCLLAGAQTRIPTKIARVRSLEYVENQDVLSKDNLQIDLVINPGYIAVSSILKVLEIPGATDIVDFESGDVKLIGCRVQNPLFREGVQLKSLREKCAVSDMVIVAIYRTGEVIIPRGSTTIKQNDFIYAITSQDSTRGMMQFFCRNVSEIRKVMIVGGGNIGMLLARELEKRKVATKIVEANEQRCIEIAEKLNKTVVLHYGGELEDMFAEEQVDDVDAFIAVTDDEEENILLSLLAKQKGAKKVVSLIHNMTYTQLVSEIGIDLVINPHLCAINRILQFIRKGKILSVASFYEKNAEAIEAVALETSDIVNKPISRLKFPEHAVIGAIVRDGRLIIPNGDSIIVPEDRVIIFSLASDIARVEKMLTVKIEYW